MARCTPTNSVLQAHLPDLKAELRKLVDVVPGDLNDSPPSDSLRSSIQTLSSDPSTSIRARHTSTPYSAYSTLPPASSSRPMPSAETVDAATQSSSIDAQGLGSPDSASMDSASLDVGSISIYSPAS